MTVQMVASSGVHLSVQISGLASGATIILLHGFPDTHRTWDRVVPLLEPYFRVVTYDVRGAGGSTAPADRTGYRIDRLVDDLVAVIGRARPDGAPVHLVGHDWGSVQMWAAVMAESSDARLRGRIASFTSIGGPGLDLFGHFIASSLRRRRFAPLARQLRRSWYLPMFRLPFLPEFAFRRFGGRIRGALIRRQRLAGRAPWGGGFGADAANGVNLYRQNGLRLTAAVTTVPVHLIVPTADSFVSPEVYADVADFAPVLERTDIAAGHWVIRTHPEVIAAGIRAFAERRTA